MSDDNSDWKRMSFKGNKVWVPVDENGTLQVENGKVLIKYNLKQDYEYRVKPESLKSDAPENLVKKKTKTSSKAAPKKKTVAKTTSDANDDTPPHDTPDIIHVFTDGASSGNPGPSGIGVFLRYNEHEKKISRNIGHGTNNIAELEAIKTGLLEIKNRNLPIQLYTDSSYALGLLSKGWKPKKNQELVESIKVLLKSFPKLSLIKVKGHSGIPGNEMADELATSAIEKEATE